MQKIIFGIFAHPDDEAFGPCGTLLTETRNGSELHLVTLTAGENGTNPDNIPHLGEVRLQEWRKGAELLGATSTHHLGYGDGTLGNSDHVAVTSKLKALVIEALHGRDEVEIEFMCFDLNGLTGHIDHIVASRSACLAFYQLKADGLPLHRIRFFCLPQTAYPSLDTGFVYMEQGRAASEITEIVDNRAIVDDVRAIMRCHHTQRKDCDDQITRLGDNIAVDHFIVQT